MVDPEKQKKALKLLGTVAFIAVAAAVTASVAWYAVVGLVGWAVAGGITLAILNFAPAVGEWFSNWRIKLMVAAWEANPIESMLSLYTDKKAELTKQEQAIIQFNTQFKSVSQMVDELKVSDPEEAKQYADMRDKMKEGLDSLRGEQSAATQELGAFKLQIDKAQRIWKVANAMNAALASSANLQQQVFADIKKQVSFDTVKTNLNTAFARLDEAVERRKNNQLFLHPGTQQALPAPNIEVKELVGAKSGVHIGRQ